MTAIVARFVKKLAPQTRPSQTHTKAECSFRRAPLGHRTPSFPLGTRQTNPETRITALSGTDGSSHELRSIYFNSKLHGTGTRNEYPAALDGATAKHLGRRLGRRYVHARVRRTWLGDCERARADLGLAADRVWDYRQYAGNDGYADEPDPFYSWDSTVPRHADLQVGDRVVVWDKKELIGFLVIQAIESEPGTKVLRRCPDCAKSRIKLRRTISPAFKCQECSAEFDEPESRGQTHNRIPVTT